ncbi:MAG: ribosome small subunit-dependent GTPase A [Bryobacterales bacterium]|nr:ribosome small subunit-dependent GTPase A [Bryobacterales bacterium]
MKFSSDLLVRARVCEAAQERYCVRFEDGSECDAEPAGVLRWSAELPAVGDWVRTRRADASLALIEQVEPRVSSVSRQRPGGRGVQVLAANVDLIVIVMGLDGDYNLSRLERYLVLAKDSGVEAFVALNKMDLRGDWLARLRDVRTIADHAIAMSARESVAPIREAVRGRTAVLLGSSGAGKSTIMNALIGETRQHTRPVRKSDSRGRHTTIGRMLVDLPDGGALIDTPGLRELALRAGQDAVDDVFAGIAALTERCRFRNCSHAGEPGCAVAAAVQSGELDTGRWANYQKLLAEARYHERTVDQRAAAESKRKWKAIHKALRHHPKYTR